jgi:two-component system sensor histidine kinase DctS
VVRREIPGPRVDGNGSLLASKSKIDASATTLSYPVSFDPPGYGMVLQVTAYRGADNLAQTLIATLIIILAGAVFWSLWAVRGLIQRRLSPNRRCARNTPSARRWKTR